MNGRWLKTVLATLVVGLVSAGTAAAAPITVGQFTWDETAGLSDFKLVNTSDTPIGTPPPVVVAGEFTQVLLTVTLAPGAVCGEVTALVATPAGDCYFSLDSLLPAEGTVVLAYTDPGVVLSATLSLVYDGYQLDGPWTITADEVSSSGLGITERYIAVVPEPASLLLLGSGIAMLARRRRR